MHSVFLPTLLAVAAFSCLIVVHATDAASPDRSGPLRAPAIPSTRRLEPTSSSSSSWSGAAARAVRSWGAAAEALAYVLGVEGAALEGSDIPTIDPARRRDTVAANTPSADWSTRLSHWVSGLGGEQSGFSTADETDVVVRLPAGIPHDGNLGDNIDDMPTARSHALAMSSRRFLEQSLGGAASATGEEGYNGYYRHEIVDDAEEPASHHQRAQRAAHVRRVLTNDQTLRRDRRRGHRSGDALSAAARRHHHRVQGDDFEVAPPQYWAGGQRAAAAFATTTSGGADLSNNGANYRSYRALQATAPATTNASARSSNVTFFCDNGVIAVPATTNFTCRNATTVGNATYNITARQYAALPSQAAKNNCTPISSQRQCICALDALVTTDVNGWVFCAARPSTCSANLITPLPDKDLTTTVEEPYRVPSISIASRTATLDVQYTINCSFTPIEPAVYAAYGWFFVNPPSNNQSFVAWRVGSVTQAAYNDTTLFDSLGSYTNLSARAYLYLEDVNAPFPLSKDHPMILSTTAARAYNFWVLSDRGGRFNSTPLVGGGQLNGNVPTNVTIPLADIPDRFLVARRLYLEAGLQEGSDGIWMASVRLNVDLTAALGKGSITNAGGLRRALINAVVPIVVVVVVVVIAAVATAVYKIRRRKKSKND